MAPDCSHLPAVRGWLLPLVPVPDDQCPDFKPADLRSGAQPRPARPCHICLFSDLGGSSGADRSLVGPLWSTASPERVNARRGGGGGLVRRGGRLFGARPGAASDRFLRCGRLDGGTESHRSMVSSPAIKAA